MLYDYAVFIRIPKTGSTSVKKTLDKTKFKGIPLNEGMEKIDKSFNNKGYWLFGHHDFKLMYENGYITNEFFNESFKFTFVRDPYTRMVSLFYYLQGVKHNHGDLKSFCKKIQKGVDPIGLYNRKGLSQCNPQYHWIFPEMNYIGKTENIDKDFKEICSYLDIEYPGKLPKHRHKGIKNYDKYYDRETRDIVNSIYDKDFKDFDYKKK